MLLLIDLDAFKPVNDSYGHKVGDELLMAIATTLRKRLRFTDSIARLGGDEFVVLLTDVTPEQAEMLRLELRAAIANAHVTVGGVEVGVTASVGMTVLDGHASDGRDALTRADAAMYAAKAAGR